MISQVQKAMPVYVANVNVKLLAYAGLYGSLCRFNKRHITEN